MALDTILIRRGRMFTIEKLDHLGFMAPVAQIGNRLFEQIRVPGFMRFVTERTHPHPYRPMDMALKFRVIRMTLVAQIRDLGD